MPEMTEERKKLVQEYLLANPELVKEMGLKPVEEDKSLEDKTDKDERFGKMFADLSAKIDELSKPDPTVDKLLSLDPTGTGDPTWGYGKGDAGLGAYAIDVMKFAQGEPTEKLLKVKNAQKAAGAGLQENVGSEGGWLVPTEQRGELLQTGIEKSDLMDKVRPLPMSSNTVKINYVKDSDHSSGLLFGGVKMYWVAEEGTTTATKPVVGQVTLSLNKLFGMAYATSELIEDSPISIGPWLSQVYTDSLAWQMDYEIINGTGTGRPEGILNSDAMEPVAKESEQAADTILAENILKMFSRMPSANRRNAIWVANEDTFPQISTMVISVGTGGVPVYLPANGLANQPFDTLMGKQIIFTEHCQTVGTVGDIFLWDPSQYLLGTKSGGALRTDTSIHLKFETDESAFRFIFRTDGRCWWPSAITPRHSALDLSCIVGLASRD